MNNILLVIKKELHRFFGDGRMVATLLLPGVFLYLLYTFMGGLMSDRFMVGDDYEYRIAVVQGSETFQQRLNQAGIQSHVETLSPEDIEAYKTKLANDEGDLLVVFPENFDQSVLAREGTTPAPNVEMYYASTVPGSAQAYTLAMGIFDSIKSPISFYINQGNESADVIPPEKGLGNMMMSLVPMLLLTLVFSGCMSVAIESIAGEKERGTMATLLVTPTKRSEVVMGKILSLGIIALCSGASGFLGLFFSLPKMMVGLEDADVFSLGLYDYVWLILVVFVTALLLVSLISVISAFAKSIKEATATAMPLMLVVALVGLTSMFSSGAQEETFFYLIPVYNSVQAMTGIFTGDLMIGNVVVTIVSTLVYTLIVAFALAKMFNSEKVMFSK
ncbi:MAG: ABC transporter permease [Peptococcaceae bacterium]|nr:ABC transporter permease [Peptococcaceae bacterium]